MKKIIYALIFFLLIFVPKVSADTKNLVNIYLFHSNSCPHCREEIQVLETLEDKYDNIKVYKYEISDPKNSLLLSQIKDIFDIKVNSVPFTVIGDKTFSGYSSDNGKRIFTATIEYYSQYGYVDEIAKLKNYEQPAYPIDEQAPDIDEYLDNYGSFTFSFPIIGGINTKDLSLQTTSILMGSIEGFNPLAIWGLLFLISILISLNDKKKMWILGGTFLIIQAIGCFLMITFPNIATNIRDISPINILVGIIALVIGIFILINNIIKKKAQNNKPLPLVLSIISVLILSIIVNLLVLTYSIGLPVMFNQILDINNVNQVQKILYEIVYVIFYLIDDFIIFVLITTSFKPNNTLAKYAKLISGLIILTIGLLLIIKPDWLIFNF